MRVCSQEHEASAFNFSLPIRHQYHDILLSCVRLLLITANLVNSSPILFTLMMEELRSFETFILTRATWRNNLQDGILEGLQLVFSYAEFTSLRML
jgi:hypothetical protein